PFEDGGPDDLERIARRERAVDREWPWTHRSSGVDARETERVAGVAGFVDHRLLRRNDELRGRAERQKLEREASKRRDRRVLHEPDFRPSLGESGACLHTEALDARFDSGGPVAPHGDSGHARFTRDEKRPADGADDVLALVCAVHVSALASERTV